MTDNTRREFIKQAALGTTAFLAMPSARVLGANERVRIGMIGVGGRGEELLEQVLEIPNTQVVAIADVYSRRRDRDNLRIRNLSRSLMFIRGVAIRPGRKRRTFRHLRTIAVCLT